MRTRPPSHGSMDPGTWNRSPRAACTSATTWLRPSTRRSRSRYGPGRSSDSSAKEHGGSWRRSPTRRSGDPSRCRDKATGSSPLPAGGRRPGSAGMPSEGPSPVEVDAHAIAVASPDVDRSLREPSVEQPGQDVFHDALELAALIPAGDPERDLVEPHFLEHAEMPHA